MIQDESEFALSDQLEDEAAVEAADRLAIRISCPRVTPFVFSPSVYFSEK